MLSTDSVHARATMHMLVSNIVVETKTVSGTWMSSASWTYDDSTFSENGDDEKENDNRDSDDDDGSVTFEYTSDSESELDSLSDDDYEYRSESVENEFVFKN